MRKNASSLILLCTVGAITGAGSAGAQTLTTLFSFPDANGSAYPVGLVKGPAGTLIGTTDYLPGNVFQLSAPRSPGGAWTENSLFAFNLKNGGAGIPSGGGLVYSGNAVYGALTAGGIQDIPNCTVRPYTGCGAIFRLSPPAAPGGSWTQEILYKFGGSPDGADPWMLTPTATGFIGVTTKGGTTQLASGPGELPGCGTVFQLTRPTAADQPWTESILYTFQGGADSCFPETILMGTNGTLIGSTFGPANRGTVFQLTPPAPGSPAGTPWTKTDLHKFSGNDGANPIGNLALRADGSLLGTTYTGGLFGFGEIYQLLPPSAVGQPWGRKILHSFSSGSDGSNPSTGLIVGPGGTYFGATQGTYDVIQAAYVNGTVYQFTPPTMSGGAWTETVLYQFADPANGSLPEGLVTGGNGMLYGFTADGGSSQQGTLFQISY